MAATVSSDALRAVSFSFDGSQVDIASNRCRRSAKSEGRSRPARSFPKASNSMPRKSWSPVATWATRCREVQPSHNVDFVQPSAGRASTLSKYQSRAWARRLGCACTVVSTLRNCDVLQRHRAMSRVVELVALRDTRRHYHVQRLWHRVRVDCAVWITARRSADSELVRLRGWREATCLVRAEAVLSGEHHRKAPLRPGRAECAGGNAEGDEP